MVINNIVVRDSEGEFDFAAEGFEVQIVEVFEDAISFVNVNGEVQTADCVFEGSTAVVNI